MLPNQVGDSVYSSENFTEWHSLYDETIHYHGGEIERIVDTVHHYHMNSLVFLYLNQVGSLLL